MGGWRIREPWLLGLDVIEGWIPMGIKRRKDTNGQKCPKTRGRDTRVSNLDVELFLVKNIF